MKRSDASREQQMKQAEELIFSGPQQIGFAKGLFFGQFNADWMMPYPQLDADQRPKVDQAVAAVTKFVQEQLDPEAIDRDSDIPGHAINELGRLGVLSMTVPKEYGGGGFSQMAYCRVMEVIGGACASTCIFINAHHSIGMRALLLFGSDEQKRNWLVPMAHGGKLGAFALTEVEAGSDAANVQTRAEPSADGTHFILNGEKRYITNGAIAQVLTVMARTPVPGKDETAVTAFLVTPDLPGFEIVEPRMEKLGIRGTATAKLAFHDMPVPIENMLGTLGNGLKVALTVLDFGRTTFGACCTGAAKKCLRLAVAHANTRRQFGHYLGEYELVKKKIAHMAGWVYAMEAMTYTTAALIDRGGQDYMLETAMLKVYTTESLWMIVNDTFQVYGGSAYFTDKPLERMLRDARINQIGEGANDVLRSFIAMVGMRGPGAQLLEVWEGLQRPWSKLRNVLRYGMERAEAAIQIPQVPVRSVVLQKPAQELGRLIKLFDQALRRCMIKHGQAIFDRQYVQERIAEAAMELFASACVLSRWDSELVRNETDSVYRGQHEAAALFLKVSARRTCHKLAELKDNDDDTTTAAADAALLGFRASAS